MTLKIVGFEKGGCAVYPQVELVKEVQAGHIEGCEGGNLGG